MDLQLPLGDISKILFKHFSMQKPGYAIVRLILGGKSDAEPELGPYESITDAKKITATIMKEKFCYCVVCNGVKTVVIMRIPEDDKAEDDKAKKDPKDGMKKSKEQMMYARCAKHFQNDVNATDKKEIHRNDEIEEFVEAFFAEGKHK